MVGMPLGCLTGRLDVPQEGDSGGRPRTDGRDQVSQLTWGRHRIPLKSWMKSELLLLRPDSGWGWKMDDAVRSRWRNQQTKPSMLEKVCLEWKKQAYPSVERPAVEFQRHSTPWWVNGQVVCGCGEHQTDTEAWACFRRRILWMIENLDSGAAAGQVWCEWRRRSWRPCW